MAPRNPLAASISAASRAVTVREYEFSQGDFERVRRLIGCCAGICLGNPRQNMLCNLTRGLCFHQMDSFAHDRNRRKTDAQFGATDCPQFVKAQMTNCTSLFRETPHFPLLESHRRKRAASASPRIGCAAASRGDGPYWIAIPRTEIFGKRPAGSLLDTDIESEALATAKRARCRREAVQACQERRLRRFFLRGAGAHEAIVRVRPDVVQRARFAPLNLRDGLWPVVPEFSRKLDVVFCRNVRVDFDRPTQLRIPERIVRILRPGGLLFLGHCENFSQRSPGLALRGKAVDQRTDRSQYALACTDQDHWSRRPSRGEG